MPHRYYYYGRPGQNAESKCRDASLTHKHRGVKTFTDSFDGMNVLHHLENVYLIFNNGCLQQTVIGDHHRQTMQIYELKFNTAEGPIYLGRRRLEMETSKTKNLLDR